MVSARQAYNRLRGRQEAPAPKQGRVRRAAGAVGRGAKRGAGALVGRTGKGRLLRGAALAAGGAAYLKRNAIGPAAVSGINKGINRMRPRVQGPMRPEGYF